MGEVVGSRQETGRTSGTVPEVAFATVEAQSRKDGDFEEEGQVASEEQGEVGGETPGGCNCWQERGRPRQEGRNQPAPTCSHALL